MKHLTVMETVYFDNNMFDTVRRSKQNDLEAYIKLEELSHVSLAEALMEITREIAGGME